MSVDKEQYLNILSNELHKPVKRKFQRRKVYALEKDEIFSMDLVDMKEFASVNDEYKYMLNAVDVFTRFAWSRPLKTKGAEEVFGAFMKIVKESGRQPRKLWVDRGSEFYNSKFKTWMKKNGVVMYSTYSEQKSVIVERFNRTLKTMMWRKFTQENTRVWVDMLNSLVDKYNNTEHGTLKMTPSEASLDKNFEAVYEKTGLPKVEVDEKMEQKLKKDIDYLPYKIGDRVRISRQKSTFEKGFHPNFSAEQFTIFEIRKPISKWEPAVYLLMDYNHEPVQGSFYAEELLRVNDAVKDIYLVDEVLKTKTVKGKKVAFVKWVGFGPEHNSWIDWKDTVKLNKNERKEIQLKEKR